MNALKQCGEFGFHFFSLTMNCFLISIYFEELSEIGLVIFSDKQQKQIEIEGR